MHSSKVKDSLTICNKLKKKDILSQTKMKPVKLPPLCQTKEEEELWDIKALPSDWGNNKIVYIWVYIKAI